MTYRTKAARTAVLAFAIACAPGLPEAIAYGLDSCSYCRMMISDRRFAAALVTSKGRTLKFDSVECLVAFVKKAAANEIASVWVSDFRNPGVMLRADTVRYVSLGQERTPMGRSLAAVASARDAAAIGVIDVSQIRRWSEL